MRERKDKKENKKSSPRSEKRGSGSPFRRRNLSEDKGKEKVGASTNALQSDKNRHRESSGSLSTFHLYKTLLRKPKTRKNLKLFSDDELELSSTSSSSSDDEQDSSAFYDASFVQDDELHTAKQREVFINNLSTLQLMQMRLNLLKMNTQDSRLQLAEITKLIMAKRLGEGEELLFLDKSERESFLGKQDVFGLFITHDLIMNQAGGISRETVREWMQAITKALTHNDLHVLVGLSQSARKQYQHVIAAAIVEKQQMIAEADELKRTIAMKKIYTTDPDPKGAILESDYHPGMEKEKPKIPKHNELKKSEQHKGDKKAKSLKSYKPSEELRASSKDTAQQVHPKIEPIGKKAKHTSSPSRSAKLEANSSKQVENDVGSVRQPQPEIRRRMNVFSSATAHTKPDPKPGIESPKGIAQERARFFERKAVEESPRDTPRKNQGENQQSQQRVTSQSEKTSSLKKSK